MRSRHFLLALLASMLFVSNLTEAQAGSGANLADQVLSQVEEHARKHWPKPVYEIQVKPGQGFDTLSRTASDTNLRVEFKPQENFLGGVYVRIWSSLPNPPLQGTWLKCKVRVFTQALSVKRDVERNTSLALAELETTQVRVRNPHKLPLSPVEDLDKLVARTFLPAGTLLFANHVESPLLVKRGDRITVILKQNNLHIQTSGIARQNGRRGDRVKVENTANRQLLTGVVTHERTIEL